MRKSKELIKLTQELIRIDSQNPPGNEKKISLFIKAYLKNLKVKSTLHEFKKNRTNVVCTIPSLKRKKSILLTPHLDTVPAGGAWRYGPLSGTLAGGKIYGRGATDCKCNVAVALYLIKMFKQEKIRLKNLDLIFAFCGDEETGSVFGIKPLVKKFKSIDYGLVLDSNEFDIIIAQKGLLHLRVEVFGREAHGAYPERGVNAIEEAIYILHDLLKLKLSRSRHPLLKKPTLNVGRIEGGDKVNIVAGYVCFDLDFRLIPSMKKENVIRETEKVLKKYAGKYKISVLASQDAVEIDRKSFLIKILKGILKKHKIEHKLKPSFGATVINFLKNKGIETFAFGFGSRGCAHIKNEYVSVNNLHKGVIVLKDYLMALDKYLVSHTDDRRGAS